MQERFDQAKNQAENAIQAKAMSKPWVLVSAAALVGLVVGLLIGFNL